MYLLLMFIILPGIFIGLAMADEHGIVMYSFIAISGFLLGSVLLINIMQENEKFKRLLPKKLENWEFLPEPLRSLAPYDQILTGYPCCKKCQDPEDLNSDINWPKNAIDFELRAKTIGSY